MVFFNDFTGYNSIFFFMHNQMFTAFSTGLERNYWPLLDRKGGTFAAR